MNWEVTFLNSNLNECFTYLENLCLDNQTADHCMMQIKQTYFVFSTTFMMNYKLEYVCKKLVFIITGGISYPERIERKLTLFPSFAEIKA